LLKMKNFITENLVYFAVSALLLGILFRFGKSYAIENQDFTLIVFLAVAYFVAMFVTGWYFGKKDHENLPIYDIGFRFHLFTYVIFFVIAFLWFLLNFNAQQENIIAINMTALFWGIFILIHFAFYLWTRRKTINGLDKKELFE